MAWEERAQDGIWNLAGKAEQAVKVTIRLHNGVTAVHRDILMMTAYDVQGIAFLHRAHEHTTKIALADIGSLTIDADTDGPVNVTRPTPPVRSPYARRLVNPVGFREF